MDFASRQNDWKSMLQAKQAVSSLLTSSNTCKVCICLDILKASINQNGDSDRVIGSLFEELHSTMGPLAEDFACHINNLQQKYQAEPIKDPLKTTVEQLEAKIDGYESSLADIQAEFRKVRSDVRAVKDSYGKLVQQTTHLVSKLKDFDAEKDRMQIKLERVNEQLVKQYKDLAALRQQPDVDLEKFFSDQMAINKSLSDKILAVTSTQNMNESKLNKINSDISGTSEKFNETENIVNELRSSCKHTLNLLTSTDSLIAEYQNCKINIEGQISDMWIEMDGIKRQQPPSQQKGNDYDKEVSVLREKMMALRQQKFD